MIPDQVSREYFHNHQNNEKLYNYRTAGQKHAKIKREQSIKLSIRLNRIISYFGND